MPETILAPSPAADPALLSPEERLALSAHLTAAEVLRRAHRRELLPLAAALRVRDRGQGRDRFAADIERTLRATGSSDLRNLLLRRGEPPRWESVLSDLARHLRLPAQLSPREIEAAVAARREAERSDERLPPTALLILWTLTRPFALIFGPLAGLALWIWLGRPREDLLIPAVAELHALRQRVEGRLTIALMGSPSAGKDAAMKAIFDVDTGNVDPVAGSTRSVGIFERPDEPGLCLVNTPGLGDVDAALTEETRGVLAQVDLTLYLINAQGGVRQRERDEFARVRAGGHPCLVVLNKIDTLRPEDRPRMLDDVRTKLAIPLDSERVGLLGAAFDPLPQLAPAPIGVSAVRAWLRSTLTREGQRTAWLDALPPAPDAGTEEAG